MRSISAALNTHKQGAVTTLARCVKIKREDGEIYGFTTVDKELSIDIGDGDGSITYSPETAFDWSSIRGAANFAPESLSVIAALDDDVISDEDLRAGRFDNAEVRIFEVNYEDLTQGILYQTPGRFHIGEITIRDGRYTADLKPLVQKYSQTVGELITVDCRNDLGDTRCKVRLEPPLWQAATAYTVRTAGDADAGSVVRPSIANGAHFKVTTAGTSGASEPAWNTTIGGTTTDGTVVWTAIKANALYGTVTSVTDNANFVASGISLEADWFTGGLIEWTTGLNAGLKHEVKADNGSGTIELYLRTPFDIAAVSPGDTFTIKPGCDKIHQVDRTTGTVTGDCHNKFDNVINIDAEPFVPGTDVALDYPDATA